MFEKVADHKKNKFIAYQSLIIGEICSNGHK